MFCKNNISGSVLLIAYLIVAYKASPIRRDQGLGRHARILAQDYAYPTTDNQNTYSLHTWKPIQLFLKRR